MHLSSAAGQLGSFAILADSVACLGSWVGNWG